MKILFVTHGADMMGANRSLLDLVEGLQKYGVQSTLLLPEKGELSAYLEEYHIPYLVSPYHPWAFTKYISKDYWLRTLRTQQNKSYLEDIIKKTTPFDFDIIYSNSSIIGIGAMLAERLSIPHVWHIREFGEQDYNIAFTGGREPFRKMANQSAAIIAISKAIAKGALQDITSPVHILHDGIIKQETLDSIIPNTQHHQDPFTFLIIGFIHPTKGQFMALQAFHQVYKKHPNTRLLIVGKGRRLYTQKIKNYIQKHQLQEAVNFLGYTKDPYGVHAKADCVLMCSKSEGMGRVTIEAMIFGNPVIGFNGGATPELITHQKNGLIYNGGVTELVSCMNTLVENRDLAAQYGKAGREETSRFLVNTAAEQVYEILKNVL